MTYGNLLALLAPTKRKIFVSYHHAGDQWFYDEFSRVFHDQYEAVRDNSVDRLIDSDDCEYVMRCIRENFLTGTSCTVVLCGRETRWRKFVDWEIKATLDRQHGLIGILLPTNPADASGSVHIPDRLSDNINSGYAICAHWRDLQAGGETFMRNCIEAANSKSVTLVRNARVLRQRNG